MMSPPALPPPSPGTLCFTMPPGAVATYRTWRAQADLDYLRVQIEGQGHAMVVRLGGQDTFERITELPALGWAEPYYGTSGGGFPFTFRPGRGSCWLTVAAPPVIMLSRPRDQMSHPPVAEPLELAVEPVALLDHIIETPGGHGVLDECPGAPGAPWRFAIAGPLMARLLGWGWDSAVPGAYAYEFLPTSVGCFVWVADLKSGAKIHLTEDFIP